MTGAIKRRVEDPPTQGNIPPNDDDPIHPDQHGDVPPNDDEMLGGDEPEDTLDDDHQTDFHTGPDPDDITDDDHEYIIPDDGPGDDLDMPGIQDSGETHDPSSPSNPFSNPDVPIEEIADPAQDDDRSPGPDPTSEPIRVQRKQRQISTDSTDALPKAKAKVIIKRSNVQLPGRVQPISVPTQKHALGYFFASRKHTSVPDPNFPDPFQTPNLGNFLGFQTPNLGYVLGFHTPKFGVWFGRSKGIEDQQKLPSKWYV